MKNSKSLNVLRTSVIALSFAGLSSCSNPAKELADKTCKCFEPLLEYTKDKDVIAADEWFNSLDILTKNTLNTVGYMPEGIDTAMAKKYLANVERSEKLIKTQESCFNAMQDEFKEELASEELAKEWRINVRKTCPEVAELAGL